MPERLSIGIVAKRTGVTPDTIRYYERLGLLPKPARTPAGYREYSEGIVNRLVLIRNAQQFGFPLREIAVSVRQTPFRLHTTDGHSFDRRMAELGLAPAARPVAIRLDPLPPDGWR